MTEEKRNRIKAAITINAVLLVFIIVVLIIVQIVQISVLSRRKAELVKEHEQLSQLLDEREKLLDAIENDEEYFKQLINMLNADEDYYDTVMQMLQSGVYKD